MIVKKWFTILLALAFFVAPVAVFADDDDEYEYYDEEEETPKKSSKKKAPAKKKSADDGPSRIGLYTSFGASSPTIGVAYDLGTGLQFGLGIGLDRRTYGDEEAVQKWSLNPLVVYSLGKGLLGYGLGLSASVSASTITEEGGHVDGPMDISLTPNFYVSTALVPNVALSLNAGLRVDMIAEAGDPVTRQKEMNMELVTSLMLIFYFM